MKNFFVLAILPLIITFCATPSVPIQEQLITENDWPFRSLEMQYKQEAIDEAKALLAGAAAVYGGSFNVVSAGGKVVKYDKALITEMQNGVVYVPLVFFKDYLQIQNTAGIKELSKKINRVSYVPAAEAAKMLGLHSVVDGKLAVIGKDKKIDALKRPGGRGVNELSEIIAYLAFYNPPDYPAITIEAMKKAKDNWRTIITGNKDINDVNDANIAAIIKSVNDTGKAAWDRMIKTEGSTEMFTGIISTASDHMHQCYNLLYRMARVWGTYGAPLYHNEDLKNDILFGIEWMYQNRYGQKEIEGRGWRNPREFNWWDWEIGSPQYLIPTMLIMEEYLTTDQKKDYLAYYDSRVPVPKGTGSNKAHDVMLVTGSALLKDNAVKVVMAQTYLDTLFLFEDNIRNQESQLKGERAAWTENKGHGFYTDGSFIYHTLHPMNGTYGFGQISAITDYLQILQGTPFTISTPQADNIYHWIYNAFDPLMYQAGMFRMVLGREHPPNPYSKGREYINNMLKVLDFASPQDAEKIKSIIKEYVLSNPTVDFYNGAGVYLAKKLSDIMNDNTVKPRGDFVANHVYYIMDKIVHQRGDWAMGISMSSSRIFNYESINDANKKGWYLGDGRTEYHVRGIFAMEARITGSI